MQTDNEFALNTPLHTLEKFTGAAEVEVGTLYIIIDDTPISTFCIEVGLSENHLSNINK